MASETSTPRFPLDRLSKSQRASIKRFKERLFRVIRAILSYPSSIVGISIVSIFIILAVFAPYVAPYNPQRTFVIALLQPPTGTHILGTTHVGRDVFSQWVYGARVSLIVAFTSGFVVAVIGTTVGLVAGYYKGTVDLVIMRVVDVMYAIPATPLILVVALFFGSSVWNIIIAMALVLWRTVARIIRAQTLSLSERPFVKSARAAGASDLRIMYYHIAPNLLPLIFVETTFVMGFSIALEAGISFLGLGAQNTVSWGSMLQLTFTTGAIRSAWWWVLPPGIGITILILSFFYISRAIEEVTNPEAGRFE